jgi:hypothetical protein
LATAIQSWCPVVDLKSSINRVRLDFARSEPRRKPFCVNRRQAEQDHGDAEIRVFVGISPLRWRVLRPVFV